jgi:lysophospholipase L1-like esterase
MKRFLSLYVLFVFCASSTFADVINPPLPEINMIKMPSRSGKANGWIHVEKEGKLEIVKEGKNGNFCLLLTGGIAVRGTEYKERPLSRRYNPDGIINRFYKISAIVKGKGTFRVGIDRRAGRAGEKGKRNIIETNDISLNDQWQEVVLKGVEDNPLCNRHLVRFRLLDGEKVYIDNIKVTYYSKKNVKFEITPRNIVGAPGDLVNLKISSNVEDKIYIRTYDSFSGVNLIAEEIVKNNVYTFKIPEEVKQSYRLQVSVPKNGINKIVHVAVTADGYNDKMNKIAKKIKVDKPLKVAVLGDSLSDFFRGYNYIDTLDYYLNKNSNNKINFLNAGVGGDFITRVWNRLKGTEKGAKKSYRQYMYNNFFDFSPDVILFFLGANDCKLTGPSNHTIPVVTPEVQDKTYRQVLAFIKEKTNAKIIFIECPSFNFDICKANARRVFEIRGKKGSLFGKPSAVEKYNGVSKKLVNELKLGYVNLYDLTKNYKDKPSLYLKQDGVHLTEKGNQFVAMEVLRYLEKNGF